MRLDGSQSALKLSNAALEKHPHSCLIKGLKGLALVRTGKHDEAHKVSHEAVTSGARSHELTQPCRSAMKCWQRVWPTIKRSTSSSCACGISEGPTTSPACMSRRMSRTPTTPRLWSGSSPVTSGEETVAAALFLPFSRKAYTDFSCAMDLTNRERNFAKQQQAATKLNKLIPNARHLWWIVLSIALQAKAAVRGATVVAMEPSKLIQLAESLVARQAGKDGRLDGYEALLVYLDLLLAQVGSCLETGDEEW